MTVKSICLYEVWGGSLKTASNKSLQVTFDPPPTFAVAKAGVASNAPELRRWAARPGSAIVRRQWIGN